MKAITAQVKSFGLKWASFTHRTHVSIWNVYVIQAPVK